MIAIRAIPATPTSEAPTILAVSWVMGPDYANPARRSMRITLSEWRSGRPIVDHQTAGEPALESERVWVPSRSAVAGLQDAAEPIAAPLQGQVQAAGVQGLQAALAEAP